MQEIFASNQRFTQQKCSPLVLTGSESAVVSSHCPPAGGTSRWRRRRCWGWRLRRDYRSRRFPCQPEQRSDLSCNRERWDFSSRSSVPIATAGKHLDTHTHTYTTVSHTSAVHVTIKSSGDRLTLKSSVAQSFPTETLVILHSVNDDGPPQDMSQNKYMSLLQTRSGLQPQKMGRLMWFINIQSIDYRI